VAVQHAVTTSSGAAPATVFQTVGSATVITIAETCLMSRTAVSIQVITSSPYTLTGLTVIKVKSFLTFI